MCLRIVTILVVCIAASSAPGDVRYVDDDASPPHDGLSWKSAYRHLQDAMAEAALPGATISEIRIAHGTYRPDTGVGQTLFDRDATFGITTPLQLRGGFAGVSSRTPDEYDPIEFPTVLTGDLFVNDLPGASADHGSLADNSKHVITVEGAMATTLLDGLIIERGVARQVGGTFVDTIGGGVTVDAPGISFRRCVFRHHRGSQGGAIAMFQPQSTLVLEECVFLGNRASHGSGVWSQGGTTVRGCRFEANGGGPQDDGALFIDLQQPLLCEECVFRGNKARSTNRGAAIAASGQLTLRDSVFEDNYGQAYGAVTCTGSGFDIVERCQFMFNRTDGDAGAVQVNKSSSDTSQIQIVECEFEGNWARERGGAIRHQSGIVKLERSNFHANACGTTNPGGGHGGAIELIVDASVQDCVFIGNTANRGGAVYGDPKVISNCWFDSNSAVLEGGAGVATRFFANCRFTRNQSQSGGAIITFGGGFPLFVNCEFIGNTADVGAVIVSRSIDMPRLVNCTLVGNATGGNGGAVTPLFQSIISLHNCILWDNTNANGSAESAQIVGTASQFNVSHCHVQAWSGALGGDANQGDNPAFVDAAGPDFLYGTADDDLNLLAPSPCVDSGQDSLLPADLADLDDDKDVAEPTPFDIANAARVVGRAVDRGSRERPIGNCVGDIAPAGGDGVVNVSDLLAVISAWGPCLACPSDITRDGTVGVPDLLAVIAAWGLCPALFK